jgi:hypothetical protein
VANNTVDSSSNTLEEIIAKAGVASLFELAATLSQEEMEKLFSIAMAGYNQSQQSKISSQDQSNPNKRNQEGEHPNGMQVDEATTYETITDEDIAKMVCDEDKEDYSLGREYMRIINKMQKKAAKANSPNPPGSLANSSNVQGPFSALKAKAYTFAAGFRTIPSSEPVQNPFKAQ